MRLSLVLVITAAVAVVLGTVFSYAYPRVEIGSGIVSLLVLVSLLLVLVGRSVLHGLRRKKS